MSGSAAIPTNLYGPGDNFDLETSHVLPALMRKMHEASERRDDEVRIWGSGRPRREFLHVDDLADACVFLLNHYSAEEPLNVGCGTDVTIAELASMIGKTAGFDGRLAFDTGKPDGAPRKLLDCSRLTALGWRPSIPLEDGLRTTYDWYRQQPDLRGVAPG